MRGVLRSKGRGSGKNDHWKDCYSVIHSSSGGTRRSVAISGDYRVNRALDGDVVALELVRAKPSVEEMAFIQGLVKHKALLDGHTGVRGEGGTNKGMIGEGTSAVSNEALEGIVEGASDDDEKEQEGVGKMAVEGDEDKDKAPQQLYARVVGVIRRNWRQYAGSIDPSPLPRLNSPSASSSSSEGVDGDGDEQGGLSENASYLFTPVDKKVPPISIETRTVSKLQGRRLLVSVDAWPVYSPFPLGHFVQVLGKDGDKDVETAVLLHEFDVPHADFTTEVMACLLLLVGPSPRKWWRNGRTSGTYPWCLSIHLAARI